MRSNALLAIVALLLASGGARAARADATVPPPAPAPCDPQGSERTDYCRYPVDVREFIDSRDGCDHWRGEPWASDEDMRNSDPAEREGQIARRKEILDAIAASCTGTDKRLAALKVVYANDSRILKLLDEFDVDIEPGG